MSSWARPISSWPIRPSTWTRWTPTSSVATRDAVHIAIKDFLWREDTDLPMSGYTETEVEEKAGDVFLHVFRAYPTLPSPFYEQAAA